MLTHRFSILTYLKAWVFHLEPAFSIQGWETTTARSPRPRDIESNLPMRTTRPATRPAHSLFQLRAHPLDVLPSCLRLLDGDRPADPFIARQRSNILPLLPRRRVGNQRLPQILRHAMHHPGGQLPQRDAATAVPVCVCAGLAFGLSATTGLWRSDFTVSITPRRPRAYALKRQFSR